MGLQKAALRGRKSCIQKLFANNSHLNYIAKQWLCLNCYFSIYQILHRVYLLPATFPALTKSNTDKDIFFENAKSFAYIEVL